jgi:hypothetical protein
MITIPLTLFFEETDLAQNGGLEEWTSVWRVIGYLAIPCWKEIKQSKAPITIMKR